MPIIAGGGSVGTRSSDSISNVESFINSAIYKASKRLRKSFGIGDLGIVGSDPTSMIWIFEDNGERKVFNITVEERKA